jgi:hypothetical protein
MFRLLFILPCLTLMFQPLNAKVEAPNYNFSLDTLADFNPQKNKEDLDKKYGQAEVMNEKNGITTLKYYVAHLRYKFPVIVQIKDGKVLDFFAKLPSYFLHDVFFQSLINRLGKQDFYKRVQEEAVYRWNKNELTHVYSAACTITCFPIFYAVHTKEEGAYKPLLHTLKESVPKF